MAHHANFAYSKKTPGGGQSLNYTMMQGFEWYSLGGGVHWRDLKAKIPELSDIGVTALWLPPPCKAAKEDCPGYDIYDVWDLGEFNQKNQTRTKYGTKEELVELVRYADKHGIVSYVDAVLNHKSGADKTQLFRATKVDPNNRLRDISGSYDISGWTQFDFPGRNNVHSDFKWKFHHFTGVDRDDLTKEEGLWRIHGDFKYWARGVDTEKYNYDYFMGADIDHKHPEVKDDLFRWGEWVVDEIGAAGFRFDAIKHIDYEFIAEFIRSARARTQKPHMFAVGEFWKDNLWDIDNYLNNLRTQFSVFDVPLHYNFKEASASWNRFDMRTIFNGTLVRHRPADAVTFVDNHDTQIGRPLQPWMQPWFKPLAYALILLRREGYPCVFYGDLFGTGGKNPQQPVHQLADFIRARKLFAYGETWDWWDHPNCIGWVRTGDKDHDGCVVVLCNGSEGYKQMNVGKEHAGEQWTDLLGWHQGAVTINGDGSATFMCPAGSVSIWTRVDARGRKEFKREKPKPKL